MGAKRIRRAALVTALGLFVGLSPTVSAQAATGPVGTFSCHATGITKSVRVGSTIHARIWYDDRSRERMAIATFDLVVAPPAGRSSRGVTVKWLNPLTGHWQNSSTSQNGDFRLEVWRTGRDVVVSPGVWHHIDVQIAFGKAAASGPWSVITSGIGTYQMLDGRGRPTSGWVNPVSSEYTVRVHR